MDSCGQKLTPVSSEPLVLSAPNDVRPPRNPVTPSADYRYGSCLVFIERVKNSNIFVVHAKYAYGMTMEANSWFRVSTLTWPKP